MVMTSIFSNDVSSLGQAGLLSTQGSSSKVRPLWVSSLKEPWPSQVSRKPRSSLVIGDSQRQRSRISGGLAPHKTRLPGPGAGASRSGSGHGFQKHRNFALQPVASLSETSSVLPLHPRLAATTRRRSSGVDENANTTTNSRRRFGSGPSSGGLRGLRCRERADARSGDSNARFACSAVL